ncbi:hypothetical protein Mucpa_1489 [Mucilaginibacter paludis DSM 18603]|uniref:Uncharacterized protein n=2 Tax=Mucilaginibacter TaxID=423349 RepID=H1Y1U4_9SPHI|nr:DUF2683 family protein [Mucilaginibacter paludis]EHQ25647.1 hypothetical protein Mucpa_1489 [Mucilaginibacter paludis DSM 18603]
MKINFEKEEESPYHPEFVAKIKRGEKAMREGKGVKVDMDNLWFPINRLLRWSKK